MIKVLIADDQELIRQSLQIVLGANTEMRVVDTAATGQEVMDKVRRYKPDVVLMDIRMPELDGVQCTRMIKQEFPWIKVVILTTFDDDEYVFNALKYGASGYLLKGVSMQDLAIAICTAAEGGAMIHPNVATKVLQRFSKMAQTNKRIVVSDTHADRLTQSEYRVIQQVGFGMSNKEIAAKLCLSEGTIRNYLSGILNKLALRDRTQLAIWAVQTGLVDQELPEGR